jgi:branched-chain amino acid transport system permease protein
MTGRSVPAQAQWLAGAATVAALAILGSLLSPEPLTIATTVLFFVTLAQSWNVIGGFAGYPSLGQVTFSGVGGYCAAVLTARAGVWFWAALPVSAVFTAAVAAILGAPLLRLRRNAFAVATLGLAAGTQQLAASLAVTGGGAGLTIPTNGPGPHTAYPGPLAFYWAFLALAAGAVAVVAWLATGRFGLALRAIRADEAAASSSGVATTRTKVAALSLSASLAGTAGALLAFQQVVVFPDSLFDISTTTLIVVMAVVGGRGTVLGPVVGAVVFGTLKAALPLVADKLYPPLLPALIIAAVILLPDGVVGIARSRPGARFPALEAIRRYRL